MVGEVVLLVAGLFVFCFGFVLLFGAPYLPTLGPQVGYTFELLNLRPGQTILELGCGDGRVLRAAAQRNLRAIGYELNPLLVIIARIYTWRYRQLVQVRWANYWTVDWPPADAIYGFILPKYMPKLDKKIVQSFKRPVKVVSFAFAIPHKKPLQTRAGIFLYDYH